jgi:hypothetical protein
MVVQKKTLHVDILLNIPQSPSMLPTFHMCIHEATAHKAIKLTSSLNDLFISKPLHKHYDFISIHILVPIESYTVYVLHSSYDLTLNSSNAIYPSFTFHMEEEGENLEPDVSLEIP